MRTAGLLVVAFSLLAPPALGAASASGSAAEEDELALLFSSKAKDSPHELDGPAYAPEEGVRVFSATSLLPPERVLHPSGPGGPPDPHVWTHPELAGFMVNAVEAALKEQAAKERMPNSPSIWMYGNDGCNSLTVPVPGCGPTS